MAMNRETKLAKDREKQRERLERDGERINARRRERYATDAELRQRQKERDADYRKRNRDKIAARNHAWNERNRDAKREYNRRYREENLDRLLEYDRSYRQANRDEINERSRLARGDAERARDRARHWSDRDKRIALMVFGKHGLRPEDVASMYQAQGARCYLCGEPMAVDEVVIEHDHRCSHPRGKSCRVCHRGLAHGNCNTAVGLAGDDPDRLRRMADALEVARLAYEGRKAEAAEQLTLELEG